MNAFELYLFLSWEVVIKQTLILLGSSGVPEMQLEQQVVQAVSSIRHTAIQFAQQATPLMLCFPQHKNRIAKCQHVFALYMLCQTCASIFNLSCVCMRMSFNECVCLSATV